MIHTVKSFSIVNDVDDFLNSLAYSMIQRMVAGSSAFSKYILNISKFLVHIVLKPTMENFEHYFASVWDECNCVLIWTFFVITFLWDGFPSCSAGKESACNAGDLGLIPDWEEEGKGSPLQYSGLENSMDYIVHRVAKSWTWLSDFHLLTPEVFHWRVCLPLYQKWSVHVHRVSFHSLLFLWPLDITQLRITRLDLLLFNFGFL